MPTKKQSRFQVQTKLHPGKINYCEDYCNYWNNGQGCKLFLEDLSQCQASQINSVAISPFTIGEKKHLTRALHHTVIETTEEINEFKEASGFRVTDAKTISGIMVKGDDLEIDPETDFIYLASPYSHKLKSVQRQRARAVSFLAAELIAKGLNIFCPISHSYPIVNANSSVSISHDRWLELDKAILSKCTQLWVVKLDGWELSKGVKLEIELAKKLGLVCFYIDEHGKKLERF